jgi:hypothetical protein
MVASGDHVRAVAWLHHEHPYPQGEVSPEFLERLKQFAGRWGESTWALGWGCFRGLHTCEFCRKIRACGNFGVPSGDVLFMAPEMIVHYVEQHRYLPPTEFVTAVLGSPLPGTEEYRLAVERFPGGREVL